MSDDEKRTRLVCGGVFSAPPTWLGLNPALGPYRRSVRGIPGPELHEREVAEEAADVGDQEFGNLERGEVAAFRHLGPVTQIPCLLGP